jgi:molybdopterin-binding protein
MTTKVGARNQIKAKVTSVKTGDVMSLVKFQVIEANEMSSVMTTESVADMELKPGDEVELIIKAINVLAAKA